MLPTAPIRQTIERHCRICGDTIEDATRLAVKICYGCWCDRQINLKAYQKKEQYTRFTTTNEDPIRNATAHPKTGIVFLDTKKIYLWEFCHNSAQILEMRFREQQMGMEHSEYWHPNVYS